MNKEDLHIDVFVESISSLPKPLMGTICTQLGVCEDERIICSLKLSESEKHLPTTLRKRQNSYQIT